MKSAIKYFSTHTYRVLIIRAQGIIFKGLILSCNITKYPHAAFRAAVAQYLLLVLVLVYFSFSVRISWAEGQGFTIQGYKVEGDSQFSEAEVNKLLAKYIGQAKTIEDMKAAQRALTAAYADKGYGIVKITLPPQESKDGYISLLVKQITISNVVVSGNQYHSDENIRHAVPALKEGSAVDPTMLARQLRQSNDNPSKQVTLTLLPAVDDQVDGEIVVADKSPLKLFPTYDNTGTHQTGPSRISVGLQHSNLFGLDHVLTAQYITSPNNYGGVRIWGLGYQLPIYNWAHDISFYAAYSDVNSGTINNLLSISGTGYIYGMRYQQNFANRGYYKDKLIYGLEYRQLRPSVTFFDVELAAPLDLHPASITYSGSYINPGKVDANFSLSAVSNISGGKYGSQQDFTANRFGSDADYKILKLSGAATKSLPRDWVARANFSAQYTEDLLVSAEQFGAGGADSVRGFLEREVRNDKGLQFSAELYTSDLLNAAGPAWFCGSGHLLWV